MPGFAYRTISCTETCTTALTGIHINKISGPGKRIAYRGLRFCYVTSQPTKAKRSDAPVAQAIVS